MAQPPDKRELGWEATRGAAWERHTAWPQHGHSLVVEGSLLLSVAPGHWGLCLPKGATANKAGSSGLLSPLQSLPALHCDQPKAEIARDGTKPWR